MSNDFSSQLEQMKERFSQELAKIRTSRASSFLVEDVLVEQYGTKMALKQIALITTPQANLIQISPYDQGAVKAIEKALAQADLGSSPVSDGSVIRLTLAPMTGERRTELTKKVAQLAEQAKVAARQTREGEWKIIQERERKKEISQDEKFRQKNQLDKTTAEYNQQIEELAERKKSEISQ